MKKVDKALLYLKKPTENSSLRKKLLHTPFIDLEGVNPLLRRFTKPQIISSASTKYRNSASTKYRKKKSKRKHKRKRLSALKLKKH